MTFARCIILYVLTHACAQFPGDFCRLPRHYPGFCTHISRCPFAIRALRRRIMPINCGFDRMEPIVCCPDMRMIVTPPHLVPQDKNPVFPEQQTTTVSSSSEVVSVTSDTTTEEIIATSTVEPGTTAKQQCDEYYKGLSIADFLGKTVIGGVRSLNKEFPHMAAIGFGNQQEVKWLCGGSLISLRFVITAAHCLYAQDYGDASFVRLGDLNLYSDTDDAQPQDFLITDRYAHPKYKAPQQYNDIALVRLDKEAVITPYVRPLCLQVKKELPSYSPIATGWGTLQFGGETSDYLMKVTLKYFSWDECQAVYKNASSRKLSNGIDDDTQLCAGGRNEEKDTCQGDSGGPLQVFTGRFYLVGITSFGKACGIANTPGVYTRISYYIPWIESIVWNT